MQSKTIQSVSSAVSKRNVFCFDIHNIDIQFSQYSDTFFSESIVFSSFEESFLHEIKKFRFHFRKMKKKMAEIQLQWHNKHITHTHLMRDSIFVFPSRISQVHSFFLVSFHILLERCECVRWIVYWLWAVINKTVGSRTRSWQTLIYTYDLFSFWYWR